MTPGQIDMIIEEFEAIRSIIAEFNTDNFLLNNESREFGKWKFEVIFTPGHAAGIFAFSSERKIFCWPRSRPAYIAPILSLIF